MKPLVLLHSKSSGLLLANSSTNEVTIKQGLILVAFGKGGKWRQIQENGDGHDAELELPYELKDCDDLVHIGGKLRTVRDVFEERRKTNPTIVANYHKMKEDQSTPGIFSFEKNSQSGVCA